MKHITKILLLMIVLCGAYLAKQVSSGNDKAEIRLKNVFQPLKDSQRSTVTSKNHLLHEITVGADIAPQDEENKNIKLKKDLLQMIHSGRYFNASVTRNKIFERWAHDPEVFNNLKRGLYDRKWIKKHFKLREQASRRHFAIQLLEYLYRVRGEPRHLEDMINHFAEIGPHELQKDRQLELDFKDLLHAYLRNTRQSKLNHYEGLNRVFEKLGLKNTDSYQVQDWIDDEFYMAIYPALGRKKAARLLAQVNPLKRG